MEVHLRGLPEHLQEEALAKRLQPCMEALGIPREAFTCEKPRRQKWANITFMELKQGNLFLQRHGEVLLSNTSQPGQRNTTNGFTKRPANGGMFTGGNKGPRRKARLQLMGNDIFCAMSKNPSDPRAVPGKPNPITMRALRHAAEEKVKPTQKTESEGSPQVFEVRSLSCGHNVFDGDRLVYIPETEFEDTGTAKFTKRTLLIKLRSRRVIRIPLETVAVFTCSFQHTFTLTLSEEPSFFVDMSDLEDLFQQLTLAQGRVGARIGPTRTRLCNLGKQHAQVVGHCLVYRMEVSGPNLQRMIWALKNHDVIPFVRYDVLTQRTPPLQLGSSHAAMSVLMKELGDYTRDNSLPFGILFELQALAWNAYLHPGTVLALAKEMRRVYQSDKAAGNRPISVDAMKMLFKQIDWPKPHGDPSEFKVPSIIQLLKENEGKLGTDFALRQGLLSPTQNLALIHRVTVTPSRMTLHGPELEAKNRVLRKFPNHHEYFVRVQFCDENGQDLFFNPRVSFDEVYSRFKRVFSTGIQIAGRTYSFLGFSHSSLRSHSVWFSSPFVDDDGRLQTYFSIVGALGIFSHIRSPARCAARIGQAFSETPFYLPLNEHNITVAEVADVTSSDQSRVFSDGVGKISWDVVHAMWDVIPQKKAAPTAFQVRYRGSKGMLALDSTLSGPVVCIRPSMKKFESNDAPNLEICDMASKPIPLVLNRQMVKILEDMGVNHDWFFDMQNIEVNRLRQVAENTSNVATFLKHQNVGEGIRFHRLFRQADNMGIDYRKDGFLCSVVQAVILRELRLLKHKARIPIRQGITLFGIMDETGFLMDDEVYVTYDTMGDRFAPPPGPGRLLVTRSPALHPGDIQLPRNVIPPEGHPLREHYNVIVFSRRGARDLPSQLSGGDLDGDIYNIIWDPKAMPSQTFGPADYPRVAPLDIGREVDKDDMADFFVDFMRQDNLGVIATRHMVLADQKDEGTTHPFCLKLAELHSTAVDFSKTGIPVNLGELPRANKYRPDFLAPGPDCRVVDKSNIELDEYILQPAADEEEDQFSGPRHAYYKSEKLLGYLYRAIDEQKMWHEDIKPKVRPLGASFWDDFLNKIRPRYEEIVDDVHGWISRLETAREIRGWYEEAISNSMNQYSEHPINPISELEVFIGNTINKSGVQTNRQRDSSIKLRDEFNRISTWITRQMRQVQHSPDVPLTGYQTKHDNLHLCLACVHAGGEKNLAPKGPSYGNMQSFRVVAACALLSELGAFEMGRRGGGYVGVKGATGAAKVINENGAYTRVPPPTGGF